MLKAIVITKTAKAIVKEVRKYNLNVAVDKGTSKMIITIQKKKWYLREVSNHNPNYRNNLDSNKSIRSLLGIEVVLLIAVLYVLLKDKDKKKDE